MSAGSRGGPWTGPYARAGLLWAVGVGVVVLGGALTLALMPASSGTLRSLVVLEVLLVVVLLMRRAWFSWADVAVVGARQWRGSGWLVVPLGLALLPLAFGVERPAEVGVLTLAVGYLLTGVTEELLWRGMVLKVLGPVGPWRAVLVAAALFGTAHLANVLFRENVALVLAQVWGSFCFGVAYGALRYRTGTIVPLMVVHAVTDMCAAVTAGPRIPLLVVEDAALLVFGLLALRGLGRPQDGAAEAAAVPWNPRAVPGHNAGERQPDLQ